MRKYSEFQLEQEKEWGQLQLSRKHKRDSVLRQEGIQLIPEDVVQLHQGQGGG